MATSVPEIVSNGKIGCVKNTIDSSMRVRMKPSMFSASVSTIMTSPVLNSGAILSSKIDRAIFVIRHLARLVKLRVYHNLVLRVTQGDLQLLHNRKPPEGGFVN